MRRREPSPGNCTSPKIRRLGQRARSVEPRVRRREPCPVRHVPLRVVHASATEHDARVLTDWSRRPDRSSETVPGCELRVQLRDRLGLFVCCSSDDEDDDVLRSGHAVWRDILPVDVRVARLFQPAFQEQIDRFGKMGRMLRIYILDALCGWAALVSDGMLGHSKWYRLTDAFCARPPRTLSPLRALFPLLKKFSFPNRSSCRWSAPATCSMTCTICAHGEAKSAAIISSEHILAHCENVQEQRREGAHLSVRHILLTE